jgi:hypothetical protein
MIMMSVMVMRVARVRAITVQTTDSIDYNSGLRRTLGPPMRVTMIIVVVSVVMRVRIGRSGM